MGHTGGTQSLSKWESRLAHNRPGSPVAGMERRFPTGLSPLAVVRRRAPEFVAHCFAYWAQVGADGMVRERETTESHRERMKRFGVLNFFSFIFFRLLLNFGFPSPFFSRVV